MKTFTEILTNKYEQLDEAGQVPVPGQAPAPVPGATPQAGDPNAVQAVAPQVGPEQQLVQAFQNMDFKNGDTATQVLNTAMKNLNNPDAQAYWQNVGFDPDQGFVYQQAAAAPGATPVTTAAQQAGETNAAVTSTEQRAGSQPSIGA